MKEYSKGGPFSTFPYRAPEMVERGRGGRGCKKKTSGRVRTVQAGQYMDRGGSKKRSWGPRLLGCETCWTRIQLSEGWDLLGYYYTVRRYAVLC